MTMLGIIQMVIAVGMIVVLGYESRAWRYLPTPANWTRDRRGVKLLLGTLASGLIAFKADLVHRFGMGDDPGVGMFLVVLGGIATTFYFGMKFFKHAMMERYRPEYEVKVVLGDGRIVELRNADPAAAAKAIPEIRGTLREITKARQEGTFLGMIDGSNDTRPFRELGAAERILKESLRLAEEIAARRVDSIR